MTRMILTAAALAASAMLFAAEAPKDLTQELLALERQAMDGWGQGDPGPQLAIADARITYIHEIVGKRIEGLAALKEMCEPYRGVPLFDSYEILNPKVQPAGAAAILTYRLAQKKGSITRYWDGTQVYWRTKEGWRVIHSHWSTGKAQQP